MLKDVELPVWEAVRNNTRATKRTKDFKSFHFRKEEVDNKEATKIFTSVFYNFISFIC